jgi:hypothetical protein
MTSGWLIRGTTLRFSLYPCKPVGPELETLHTGFGVPELIQLLGITSYTPYNLESEASAPMTPPPFAPTLKPFRHGLRQLLYSK